MGERKRQSICDKEAFLSNIEEKAEHIRIDLQLGESEFGDYCQDCYIDLSIREFRSCLTLSTRPDDFKNIAMRNVTVYSYETDETVGKVSVFKLAMKCRDTLVNLFEAHLIIEKNLS